MQSIVKDRHCLYASMSNPPLGELVVLKLVKQQDFMFEWDRSKNSSSLKINSDLILESSTDICRFLARSAPKLELYGSTVLQQIEVDHWLSFALGPLSCSNELNDSLLYLDKVLASVTFLVGVKLTIADLLVWSTLYKSATWKALISKGAPPQNIRRWMALIEGQHHVREVLDEMPDDVNNVKGKVKGSEEAKGRKEEGKFVDLPGAEMGMVVVRFPPEASGYLHIGHAKAALLNQYYQEAFQGKLIMRFDDTNPAKEKVDFEKVILEDLELLQIKPDMFTHTSRYFDLMLGFCEQLLRQGKAYVDDTNPETMKLEREQRTHSKNWDNSVEKNLQMWLEMKAGTEHGQRCCVRARINMESANGCMRDPTIYRCKNEPHPRTAEKYKVYPTYDFACPIVDSIEGVTHCLRTMEYHDRDDQFYWFIEALGLRRPFIWEYSRLNMTNTVLSKRKLTWFVENGYVDGWDDPRFPTVRGILRRGMTVEGLKQFIIGQGSSRSVVVMEWDKIWAFNKKVIDPVAPRYTVVDGGHAVAVLLPGVKEEALTVPKHPKNPAVGVKTVWVGPRLLIDQEDALTLQPGQNTTFINWGNLRINKINKEGGKVTSVEAEPNLLDKDYKKTIKLTWLADTPQVPFIPCVCVYFDHIISKPVLAKDEDFRTYIGHNTKTEVMMLGDHELANVKKSEIIQLQRRGFFICDSPYEPPSLYTGRDSPIVLFAIPDGHTKENSTAGVPKKLQIVPVPGVKVKQEKSALKPVETIKTPDISTILLQITEQGDKIRKLKAEKSDKGVVTTEVNSLLSLKAVYKQLTGQDWTPQVQPPTDIVNSTATSDVSHLNQQILAHGGKVRELKSAKATKEVINSEINILLNLKAEFKKVSGKDWSPQVTIVVPKKESVNSSDLHQKIIAQGDKIRQLKASKASKDVLTPEVNNLLALKSEFKQLTGQEWTLQTTSVETSKPLSRMQKSVDVSTLYQQVAAQGDKVRQLKAANSPQDAIKSEVNTLLNLKADYKDLTGKEWKPNEPQVLVTETDNNQSNSSLPELVADIISQGDKVRAFKAKKVEKSTLDKEIKALLELKKKFKETSGKDYSPEVATQYNIQEGSDQVVKNTTGAVEAVLETKMASLEEQLTAKVNQQGDAVRQLKSAKADKAAVDEAVAKLISLKAEFKETLGKEFPAPKRAPSAKKEKAPPAAKKEKDKPKDKSPEVDVGASGGPKKQTRLGLEAKKEENLPDWYSQVITKGELIEYYDVSGCYILRPWAFSIWEHVRDWLDGNIKRLGVKNCYFPIFVSRSVLEKEKTHVADFAPEVAWVTKSGESDLAEPIAIRPTSETVMYPAYAKWIQSYRDLPIKLNQWNNVVRWEFKHPQPFLRTREFLWQEGHTAHASLPDAEKEVLQILDLYAGVYTELLAIPVVKGRKTEKEKFAGADYTTTVEAFISASGRAIQGATSHHLGQNFSKMFEIVYEDPESQEKKFVYQNSWGLTTRTIGVMIMVHADNQGLVLPPRVAAVQIVIVMCGVTVNLKDDERKALLGACLDLEASLSTAGIRVQGDYRDNYSPGWKFNHWELKGVPIRVEMGPKDLKSKQLVAVRRDNGNKSTIPLATAVADLRMMLVDIHSSLLAKATEDLTAHTKEVTDWSAFCIELDNKNLLLAPFCGEISCEEKIKEESASAEVEAGAPAMGAKGLCIPFDQPRPLGASTECIHHACHKLAKYYTLFGRSY